MPDTHPKPLLNDEEPPFSSFDRIALGQLIDAVARPGVCIAEVGSWTGLGSTQTFLAKLNAVPEATLVCIDTWQGAPSCDHDREIADRYDIFGTFRANVADAAGKTRVIPLATDSITAAKLLNGRLFDLVFIDADHGYDCVKNDIATWRQKVRPGGILCGHDCEARVTAQDKPLLDSARDVDAIEMTQRAFRHFHAGVILAVDEAFAGGASLFAESPVQLPDQTSGSSTIWHVTTPDTHLNRLLTRFGLRAP